MLIILSAIQEEIPELIKKIDITEEIAWCSAKIYSGKIEHKPLIIAQCGVGKVLAAMATQYLITRYSPTGIIFSGLAGGLNSQLRRGDIVLATSTLQHDMDATGLGFKRGEIPYSGIREVYSNEELNSALIRATNKDAKIISGVILSGDQFVSSSRADYLVDELNGDAVDMESASVALVCNLNRVPWAVIRTISDMANSESEIDFKDFLPHASRVSANILIKALKILYSK